MDNRGNAGAHKLMRQERDTFPLFQRKFSRRAIFIGGLQTGVFSMLAARMYQLQIDQSDEFRLLAEENRINLRLLPPERGQIFDRNGVILAQNEPVYRINYIREDAGPGRDVLDRLAHLIRMSPEDTEAAWRDIQTSPAFLAVNVADRITWEDISRVAVNTPALPGVSPEVGLSRVYPLGHDFAHVVGYVGPVSERDLARYEDPDPILRIPRFQIGKIGIERQIEENLRGSAGTKKVEVNALGRVMREIGREEGAAGTPLRLTIDAKLQSYIVARLGEQSASVVVMDCRNGDVLANVSAPSFDPNKFVRGISVPDYSALRDNERRPLASKTVQDAYPPASTFKMVTLLAALEAGVITENHTAFCPGHLTVSGRKFHCWRRGGHGTVNADKSLRESCDVFYYEIAMKVGIDKIAQMARRLGLGQTHDIPMSAVSEGLIPNREWKQVNRGQDWLIGDTVNASIGQGYVLASPMHLAVLAARLASGRAIKPRLILPADDAAEKFEPLGLNARHLAIVQRAMGNVVNNRRGTAYGSRIIADEMRMAGKTGTSQVRNISEAERRAGVTRNSDLPWERRDHALFVNYAPIDNPRIAVSVVIEHGGDGSSAAAPIARDVTLQALSNGMPPLSAYPVKDRARIEEEQEAYKTYLSKYDASQADRA